MRLSACIDMMMKELPVPERVRTVHEAGLSAVEFFNWENKDIAELEAVVGECGLEVSAFCPRSVPLVDPAQRLNYIDALVAALPVANMLHCRQLITKSGATRPGVARQEQLDSVIAGLQACLPLLEAAGVVLLLEPLNVLVDHKGYFLSSSQEAFEVVRAVNNPQVKILYDIYHQQITEGNLIPTIQANIDLIGHFHAADHPGRHEPGTGEINYRNVLRAIAETGYQGYVGLEFRPAGSALQALQQVRKLTEELEAHKAAV